jgi:hypothetical protein
VKVIRETGGGVGVAALPASAFGIRDKTDCEWVERRLTLQPVETYQQRLVLQWALSNKLPTNNVDWTLEPIANLEPGKAPIRNDSVWNFCTLAATHDAMITAPAGLLDLLTEVAS